MLKKNITNIGNFPIKGNQIYFLAFVIYFLPTFLIETTFTETLSDHWLRLFSYLALPLLLFKIYVIDKWSKKQLLVITIILILSLVIWRTTQDVQFIVITPFIFAAKNVSFRDIMSWYLYLGATLMLTVVIFALLHIIPNLIYYSSQRPTRYSLGMNYPSIIAAHYFYFALAYCYLKFGKLHLQDYLMIFVGDLICMLLTNTRLDFIATLVLIPAMGLAQRAFKGHKWSRIFVSFWWMAVPITAAITIFSSYFYNSSNHIIRKVNSLVSGRLILGHEAFNKYAINLFGRTIIEHTYTGEKGLKLANGVNPTNVNYFYIDSSYIRMVLLWGFIATVLILLGFTYIAFRSTYRHLFVLSALILVASLNFMFEPNIIKIIYDPLLLALFANFEVQGYRVKGENNNEKQQNYK